ncbi:uncharacterized protein LOC119324989 isoform X2 [Triticum dicoccoides]|uniref:uncharacterized protein LOC119324989 isoform X2 n=1 Tax=Triticum dicoccoides TaxID=85692 RepID=UPI00188E9F82|nr:uncharacterized protein LOC119324989 isoform X2 [Triticum dicoccoides]
MHRSLPRERHRNARRIDFPNKIASIQPAAHLAAEEVRSSISLPPPTRLALCAIELLHFGTSSDNGVQPEWDVCWIFACRQYHGVPYEVGRKRRTRWPLCFTDIVGLFCKCKKMKQICRLLQLSEMGKRLRQGKDTSRTY